MTDAGPVGPVFTEWYWSPIFFALVYGPPILAVAGALYLLARPTRWRRRTRAALALMVAPALVLGGVAVAGTFKYRRAEASQARQVGFFAFAAPGLHQTRAAVYEGPRPSVQLTYEREGRELFVSEHAARDDDVTPPACAVHAGTRFVSWEGPCRSARTPAGGTVTLAAIPERGLLVVRNGTLIVATSYEATEPDLLALADDLRLVDVRQIHWER